MMFRLLGLRSLKSESDEFPHLDALRFLAAFGVMIYHFAPALPPGLREPMTEAVAGWRYLVDLFFVISGFVMARFYGDLTTGSDYLTFLRKRLARLAPLHLATAAPFVIVALTAGGYAASNPERYDLSRLPANLLMVHSWLGDGLSFNYASWSVSAEWGLYVALPVLLLVARQRVFLPLLVLGLVAFSVATPWWNWNSLARAVPSFLVGLALFQSHVERWLPSPRLVLIVAAMTFGLSGALGIHPLVQIAALYAVAAAAVACDGRRIGGLALSVAPLASLTYSIYLIHPVVGLGLLSILPRLYGLSGAAQLGVVVLGVLATLAAARVSYEFYEMPLRRWLSGRRDKARVSQPSSLSRPNRPASPPRRPLQPSPRTLGP